MEARDHFEKWISTPTFRWNFLAHRARRTNHPDTTIISHNNRWLHHYHHIQHIYSISFKMWTSNMPHPHATNLLPLFSKPSSLKRNFFYRYTTSLSTWITAILTLFGTSIYFQSELTKIQQENCQYPESFIIYMKVRSYYSLINC